MNLSQNDLQITRLNSIHFINLLNLDPLSNLKYSKFECLKYLSLDIRSCTYTRVSYNHRLTINFESSINMSQEVRNIPEMKEK